MSSIRFPLATILLLLTTACVTSSVQVPETPPPVYTTEVPELADVSAERSTFLDVSSGYANQRSAIGGGTGVRSAWFRFSINQPGDAVVTLTPFGDSPVTLALYDDSVYRDPRRAPVEIGYRLATSGPESIATDVQRGVYYVKVATGPRANRVDFVVGVTYRAAPRQAEKPPVPVTRSKPPAPVTRPAPVTVTVAPPPPAPAPAPATATVTVIEPPIEPPIAPPVLISPERREAIALASGSTATTDIGGESGYRWRWYEVTLTRKGKLRLDVTANGAPVAVELFDEKGKNAGTLDVTDTATHSARHSAGKLFIRVGPSANDEAARVTLGLKVAVAPFIRE